MNPVLDVYLEAHHADRNVHRWYHIHVSRDLFGEYVLTLGYGRVGRSGQQQRFSSPEPNPLHRIIRQRLRRRSNSPSRIQCAYRVMECESNPAGYSAVDAWLSELHEIGGCA